MIDAQYVKLVTNFPRLCCTVSHQPAHLYDLDPRKTSDSFLLIANSSLNMIERLLYCVLSGRILEVIVTHIPIDSNNHAVQVLGIVNLAVEHLLSRYT